MLSTLKNVRRVSSLFVAATLALGISAQAAAITITANAAKATTGKSFRFAPTVAGASGTVRFTLEGRPAWVKTDLATGAIYGTPAASEAGKQYVVWYTVKDSKSSASTSVKLSVVAGTTAAPAAPLSITAKSQTAVVGQAFKFAPTVSGGSGTITYTVKGRPTWVTTDLKTGTIAGTAPAPDAGRNYTLWYTVADGKSTASISVPLNIVASTVQPPKAVMGAANLSWKAPTSNTDGSVLADLAGYRVVYGTSPTAMTQKLELPGANLTSARIEELSAGTYYFAVKSYRKDGTESDLTAVIWKTI